MPAGAGAVDGRCLFFTSILREKGQVAAGVNWKLADGVLRMCPFPAWNEQPGPKRRPPAPPHTPAALSLGLCPAAASSGRLATLGKDVVLRFLFTWQCQLVGYRGTEFEGG